MIVRTPVARDECGLDGVPLGVELAVLDFRVVELSGDFAAVDGLNGESLIIGGGVRGRAKVDLPFA